MKKFITILFCISIIIILIRIKLTTPKTTSDYGHFVTTNYLNSIHYAADAIKLSDGQILVLGDDNLGIPTEIYNPKNNSVKLYKFPNNLHVNERGITLGNGKILLLDTCDSNKSTCSDYAKDFKGNIRVYDTNLKKIVSSNSLKISDKHFIIYDFFCLNDGRVFFVISYWQIKQKSKSYFAIYDFKTNNLTFSKEIPEFDLPKGVQINENEILVFQNNGPIMKYNIKNKKLTKMKSKNPLTNSLYAKIGENYILICGTKESPGHRHNDNLLYDISKDKIIKIGEMNYERMYGVSNSNTKLPYNLLPIDSTRVLITGGRKCPNWWIYTIAGLPVDAAEIYDLNKNKFIPIGKSNYTHDTHNMIRLNDNEIVLIGGYRTHKRIKDFYYYGSKGKSWIEIFKINEKVKE